MPEENSGQQRPEQARTSSQGVPVPPSEDSGRPSGDDRDPRAKGAALRRLHDASDELLAVFEHDLRRNASAAGASEEEVRDAQSEHPEHS